MTLLAYILRRLLMLAPVLVGASVIVFGMIRLIPGDPAQILAGGDAPPETIRDLRERYLLDRPVPVQYAAFLYRALGGDLGVSWKNNVPVVQEIKIRFPRTLVLAVSSVTFAAAAGIPAGVIGAVYRRTAADHAAMVAALLGVCAPAFWVGLMLQVLFAVRWPVLPMLGEASWQHLILPTLTLSAYSLATLARITRAAVLEMLGRDFVKTARGKGLPERGVVWRHVLRNALIPIVTVIGLEFGYLLTGAVVVESVFAYSGIGRYLVQGVLNRDYPVVQAVVLLTAVTYVIVNLLTDVLYAVFDPRVSYR